MEFILKMITKLQNDIAILESKKSRAYSPQQTIFYTDKITKLQNDLKRWEVAKLNHKH